MPGTMRKIHRPPPLNQIARETSINSLDELILDNMMSGERLRRNSSALAEDLARMLQERRPGSSSSSMSDGLRNAGGSLVTRTYSTPAFSDSKRSATSLPIPTPAQAWASPSQSRPRTGDGTRPGYLPSVSSGTPVAAQHAAVKAAAAARLNIKRVAFVPTPHNTYHEVTPYSKVYGQHPAFFEYNRKGEMQLTDAGIVDELRRKKG